LPRRNAPKKKIEPPVKRYQKKEFNNDEDDVKPDFKYDFAMKSASNTESEPVKTPGKHRFFHANYQHPTYTKSEGYRIAYQLCVKFEDFKKVQRMLDVKGIEKEFEPHVIEFLRDGFLVHDNWDRFEKDLKLISTKLKKMLIKVKCIGEDFSGVTDDEKDNLYIYYAQNGKAYSEDAEITFPPFDASLLM
jgi:hypothetical protein